MKIDGVDPLKGPQPAVPQNKPGPDSSFGEILDNLVSKAPVLSGAAGSVAPPGAGAPLFAPAVSGAAPASVPTAMNAVDGLLTDVEMFKNALANTDVPLERLKPLISELVARKDELAALIGKTGDEDLKSVLSDALALLIGLIDQYNAGYAA